MFHKKGFITAIHWLIGFFLSLLIIWLIGIFALPLIDVWEQSDKLRVEIHAPGFSMTDRNEGWGRTQFNMYGAQGFETIPLGFEPQICFFGDSYFQGGQVPLKRHFYNLYNQAVENGRYAIAYGYSGQDCPIYFELMKSIPDVFPKIDTYVLFLGIDDILPNGSTQQLDPPKFVYSPRSRPLNKYRSLLYTIKANAAWTLLKLSKESIDEFRIRPGPIPKNTSPAGKPDEDLDQEKYAIFLEKLINTAAAASNGRHLVIAIKETVPRIESGEIKRTVKDEEMLNSFIRLAKDRGVDIIDIREAYLQHFDQTGQFPKGSLFTLPGEGHWNQIGHQIIAETMLRHLSQNEPKT